ncbi:hypothetical protein V1478_001835 [Vespula squamosa]|uniref:Uncharacterized protein n=1 Tax=Vespula squamosa TaxID=30214 RepID=A0ABD2BYC5_VESSQ
MIASSSSLLQRLIEDSSIHRCNENNNFDQLHDIIRAQSEDNWETSVLEPSQNFLSNLFCPKQAKASVNRTFWFYLVVVP